MKWDTRRVALTGGIIWGLAIFITTLISLSTGYAVEFLNIIASIYPGFSVSLIGSIVGLIYGFLDVFIGVYIFVWVYSKIKK